MAEACSLPAVTREGVTYDPSADLWLLSAPCGPARFDFLALAGASAALRAKAKLMLRAALATLPATTVHADFSCLRALFKHASATRPAITFEEVTLDLVCDYGASLPAGARHRAGRLAVALRRCYATGAGGFSGDLASWLEWVPPEAHVAGQAVRTCCPRRGALSPSDRDAMLGGLHEAYGFGQVPLADYAMTLLTVILGLRPLQVTCIKVGDLGPPSDPAMFGADLLVTRLKQRGRLPREELTSRGLVGALADVLRLQCAEATHRAEDQDRPAEGAPMFPAGARASRFAPGFEGHLSSSEISRRVSATLDHILVVSGGGGPGHAFPLRSRRTLATTLHAEGCGVPEISVILDHTGRLGARAYIEAAPDPTLRLGCVMGRRFAELGTAFRRPRPTGADR